MVVTLNSGKPCTSGGVWRGGGRACLGGLAAGPVERPRPRGPCCRPCFAMRPRKISRASVGRSARQRQNRWLPPLLPARIGCRMAGAAPRAGWGTLERASLTSLSLFRFTTRGCAAQPHPTLNFSLHKAQPRWTVWPERFDQLSTLQRWRSLLLHVGDPGQREDRADEGEATSEHSGRLGRHVPIRPLWC